MALSIPYKGGVLTSLAEVQAALASCGPEERKRLVTIGNQSFAKALSFSDDLACEWYALQVSSLSELEGFSLEEHEDANEDLVERVKAIKATRNKKAESLATIEAALKTTERGTLLFNNYLTSITGAAALGQLATVLSKVSPLPVPSQCCCHES